MALVFTALLVAASAGAQQPQPSSGSDTSSQSQDAGNLPVSIDKIKAALEQTPPVQPLRGLNEVAHFKIEIRERQKISLDDLIKSLDFRAGPVPAGGIYAMEQQRQMFPSVDNPLRQPYAAFSQSELLTIVIENLAGKYLANRVGSAITAAERARAQAAAREEVQRAVSEYCTAQPNGGAGIQICSTPIQ